MPKYILHIGPPKTGSKTIQSQLFHSRKDLLEKRVLYPETWLEPGEITHVSLYEGLREGKNLKENFDRLNTDDVETIVLSCEALDGLKTQSLEKLREYIGGNPIEIVYYVRRWSERIPSGWRQSIMMGQYRTFPEFYARLVDNAIAKAEVNPTVVWRKYENVFGRQNLKIVSFSNLVDHGVDLFKHFCEVVVGIREAPHIKEGLIRQNAGVDMVQTEIIRAINYMHYMETRRYDPSMRIKFDLLKKHDKLCDLRAIEEHMKTDIREVQIKDGASFLRPIFEAISTYRDRLVSPEYGRRFFERRDSRVQLIGQDYLFRKGAVKEVEKLFRFINSSNVDSPALQRVARKTAAAQIA